MELIFCVLLTSVIKPSCLRITYSMEYRQNLSVIDCIVHTCGKYVFHNGTTTKWKRSSAIAEGPRDASCQLKSCQLPRNSAETTYTTSPDQIDGMKLEI